jgi:adenylosuccinate lyase
MVERYTHPEMAGIWTDRNKYLLWLKVELAVCEEMAQKKMITPSDWKVLKKKGEELIEAGGVDPKRVDKFEKVTRHDVIAFTTAVAEKIGPQSRYIHFGLTSSDVLDTGLSLQIQEAGAILQKDVQALLKILKKLSQKWKKLPTIGRSHAIYAEPTSFGLKFLGWYTEWKRNLKRLDTALEGCRVGQLSGAVGVNAHWSPSFEKKVLGRLKLRREPVSTQVIPRDRHAELMLTMAICGASLERISVELRHLQRSEVGEVLEGFKKGQKGSSAMPHKRNPISSENLTGAARMLRSYSQAAIENITLWHERDISHSSVERVFFPDAMTLLDYALKRMTGVLENLVIREQGVKANLEDAGKTVFSGHFLLELVKRGASREDAYRWIQSCALAHLDGGGDFIELLSEEENISALLSSDEIKKLGSLSYQLRHVDEIYEEVLKKNEF